MPLLIIETEELLELAHLDGQRRAMRGVNGVGYRQVVGERMLLKQRVRIEKVGMCPSAKAAQSALCECQTGGGRRNESRRKRYIS